VKWQIRVIVPPGPSGFKALEAALAGFQASELILARRTAEGDELAGDIVVELSDDDELGDLLRELHAISPQVFISRVRVPEQHAAPSHRDPIRVRSLRAAAGMVR
jgi:hypothetical protein